MTILPISSPKPAPRETLYSYLARLAAVWQTNAPDIAYDMGAPFKRFLDQEEEAFGALADWANLDLDALTELLSWTGVRAGNVRMEFRGELFISRALRNPAMRGCPVCLREDAAGSKGPAYSAMVMRGDWQFREAKLCVRHGHPLIPLWKATTLRDRFDIGARLHGIEAEILSGAFDQPRLEPSAYDLWLDQRLENGSDHTWFRDQPVFAVATLCWLLGQALLKERSSEDDDVDGRVHALGFDVAVHGGAAIRAVFDQLAATATGALDEQAKAFGPLYGKLARDYLDEPAFDQFRDILRECILDHWPKATGDVVLGQVVPERRLHSLTTAAAETGIGANVLEQFLIEAGAFKAGDNRTPSRRLFNAKVYAELLTEIRTLVGPIAMQTAMGATKQELSALAAEGVLIPRTRVEKVKNPWRIDDGVALVTELSADAIPVDEGCQDWETLLLTRKRTRVTLVDLITGIRDKQLTVGQRAGIAGFHGIVLRKIEIEVIVPRREAARKALLDEVLGEDHGQTAAAQFGRSVGLRDGGTFLALIEAGHVPARQTMNPMTGRLQYWMTPNDMAAFHERFITLTTISEETGQHRNTLRGFVKSEGIIPFSPEGQDFGPVYLRQDCLGLMPKIKSFAK
jgi:hypothetical protein